MDPTPRANTMDSFRFTPSIMDPNSYAFSNFANQPPGYYTPTPGGTNTIYHSQAGDLHTPGLTMGLGTPLSMPTSDTSLAVGQTSGTDLHHYHPSAIPPHIFQNPDPFAYQTSHQQHHHPLQLQTFAPHQFTHHATGFDRFQSHTDDPKLHDYPIDIEMQEHSGMDAFSQPNLDVTMAQPVPPYSMEEYVSDTQQSEHGMEVGTNDLTRFRFHTTLNAPTAMIRHSEEIPVTYLNKGQAYTVSIVDNTPPTAGNFGGALPTYRTYIRISFEDEQQRQKPAQCWQLWKEGRGTNEAHHRGGRLLAVEFVHPTAANSADPQSPQIQVEHESFDGFSVKWTPSSHAPTECALAVRFNFLSTDFSHSKGVKGIPVRLCAKTHLVTDNTPSATQTEAELCFCKVKLFRDHGAERKLTNDIAHVKKNIEKLKQQISQIESGMKDFGKRKRSESSGKSAPMARPGKVPKHKRTWSMSSMSDTTPKNSTEDDLQTKLNSYQDMFTSTRPASIFFLKGEEGDDPDRYPVQLVMESNTSTLQRTETGESNIWDKQSGAASSIVSPTPSNQSLHSQEQIKGIQFPRPAPIKSSSRLGSNEWQPQSAISDLNPVSHAYPGMSDVPMKIRRITSVPGNLSEWIDAVGVDNTYQPPPERVVKPGMFNVISHNSS
jgi:hypothetical protein